MLIALGTIAATIVSVLATYLLARLILAPEPEDRTRDLAASVLFRISALHGLVLALVFASEVVEYHQLSFESAIETNAVSDAYYDAARFGGEETTAIQAALRSYLEIASSSEWDSLGQREGLLPAAWRAWNDAYLAALDLTPQTPRQEALRDNILAKIHLIAENRDLREHHAKTSLGTLFWIAALAGVLLISVGYYPFPPKRDNLILLSIFATYTGFILFTILAMSNPYSAPAALEPVLFIELIAEIDS